MDIFGTVDNPTPEYFEILTQWYGPERVNWGTTEGVTAEAKRAAHRRMRIARGENTREGLFNRALTPDPELPFDPDVYQVVEATRSTWGTLENPFISNRVTVKPRQQEPLTIDAIVRALRDSEVEIEPFPADTANNERIAEICLFDLHFGQTDHNASLYMRRVTNHARHLEDIGRFVLVLGGDTLAFDTYGKTTTAGTGMEVAGEPEEILGRFFQELKHMVAVLCQTAPVEVIFLKGNHDMILSTAVAVALTEFALSRESAYPIKVDQNHTAMFKARLYFNTLVGYTHGQASKTEIRRFLPREFPGLWGKANAFRVHCGHQHHYEVDPTGVCPVYFYPPAAPTTAWERDRGYTRHEQATHINVYDVHAGLCETHIVRI